MRPKTFCTSTETNNFRASLSLRRVVLDEVVRLLPGDAVDVGHRVPEPDAVKLGRVRQQLGSEGRRDELSPVGLLTIFYALSFHRC